MIVRLAAEHGLRVAPRPSGTAARAAYDATRPIAPFASIKKGLKSRLSTLTGSEAPVMLRSAPDSSEILELLSRTSLRESVLDRLRPLTQAPSCGDHSALTPRCAVSPAIREGPVCPSDSGCQQPA